MYRKITLAAAAAFLTMALGAFALYVTVGWAQIGFDGDGKVGPFLVGLLATVIIGGGIASLRRATSRRTTDAEGFAIGICVLVVTIALTIALMIWAIAGGWDWGQFGFGILALALWGAATAVNITYKHIIK